MLLSMDLTPILPSSATGFGVYATGEGMEYYFNGYARCTQAGSGLGGGTGGAGKLATHILPNKVGGHGVGVVAGILDCQ